MIVPALIHRGGLFPESSAVPLVDARFAELLVDSDAWHPSFTQGRELADPWSISTAGWVASVL
jgi:hypothetical protein